MTTPTTKQPATVLPASIPCPCCDGANARAKDNFEPVNLRGRWVAECAACDDDGEISFERAQDEDMDRPYLPQAWRDALWPCEEPALAKIAPASKSTTKAA